LRNRLAINLLMAAAAVLVSAGQGNAQTNLFDVMKSIIDKAGPTQQPQQQVAPSPPPAPQQYAPPPPPMPPEQQAFVTLPTTAMAQIQTALQAQGYYSGTIDGAYGRQTAQGVQAWQHANGFAQTGYLDGPQLGSLLKPTQTSTASSAAPSSKSEPSKGDPVKTEALKGDSPKSDEETAIYEIGKDGKAVTPADSLTWQGGKEQRFLKPKYESAITPQTMRIRASSSGADIVWIYDEGDFSLSFAFDRCGGATVDEKCTVQAVLHDFDGDGRPEVVVTMGDGISVLKFWIVQYFRPSAAATYRSKREFWSVIFEGEGQREVDLQDGRIIVPVGNKGLFDDYVLVGRKFIKKN
jgi:peptidoglycan hydrolase-like protein with peptidoglycan-binding domain